jgi:hypothetical protein
MEYKDTLHNIYEQAKRKGACDLFPCFNGSESVAELARLMFTPQGREFCIKNRFPDLNTFRTFKPYNPEQYGVYIDAGDITLYDTDCFLIGNTRAVVRLSELRNFHVFLMHGATADVDAGGHSVVRIIADTKSKFTTKQRDNSIIL